jgi:hypothetical protein
VDPPVFPYAEPAAPALFQSATGSKMVDALVSGFAGYALGMTPGDKMAYAVVGAFAGWAAGLVGVIGTVGFGVWSRSRSMGGGYVGASGMYY